MIVVVVVVMMMMMMMMMMMIMMIVITMAVKVVAKGVAGVVQVAVHPITEWWWYWAIVKLGDEPTP